MASGGLAAYARGVANLNPLSLFNHQKAVDRRRRLVRSIKAKADAQRNPSERFADSLTGFFGTPAFLIGNLFFFLIWLLWNVGALGLPVFDPFPYVLLITVVSIEAIVLSIVVLVSQNRASRVADLREEVNLQVSIMVEEEITKVMELLVLVLEQHGVDVSTDKRLQQMLSPLREGAVEERIARELGDLPSPSKK